MYRSSHEATGFSYLKGNLEFDKLKHGAFRTSITEAELECPEEFLEKQQVHSSSAEWPEFFNAKICKTETPIVSNSDI